MYLYIIEFSIVQIVNILQMKIIGLFPREMFIAHGTVKLGIKYINSCIGIWKLEWVQCVNFLQMMCKCKLVHQMFITLCTMKIRAFKINYFIRIGKMYRIQLHKMNVSTTLSMFIQRLSG